MNKGVIIIAIITDHILILNGIALIVKNDIQCKHRMWNALYKNFSVHLRPKCSDTSTLFCNGVSHRFEWFLTFITPTSIGSEVIDIFLNGNVALFSNFSYNSRSSVPRSIKL